MTHRLKIGLINSILQITIIMALLLCSYTVTTGLGQEAVKPKTTMDDIVGTMNERTIGLLMNNTIDMLRNSTSYVKPNNSGNNNLIALNLSAVDDKLNRNTTNTTNTT